MHWLETKIPPPIVMLLLAIAAWWAARLLPPLSFALPLHSLIAACVASVGLLLNVLPKLAFQRAATTVNPLRPELSSRLVTSGIYRYTRNPMYLGQAMILLGWALYLHNAAALPAVPALIVYVTRFQIQPEERHLAARFAGAYAAFSTQVPRWL